MNRGAYKTRFRSELSPRQRQVLALIASGKTNREIGDALGMTLDGAKFHVSEVIAKLGVASREEAATWWRREVGLRNRVPAMFSFGVLKWGAAASGVVIALAAGVFVAGSLTRTTQDESGAASIEGFVAARRDVGELIIVGSGWSALTPVDATEYGELVVLGRVTSMSPGLRSGQGDSIAGIYRIATFEIEEVIKAPAGFGDSKVPVYVPGGQIGDIIVGVSDVPVIADGAHAVLFLRRPEGGFGEPGTWVVSLDATIAETSQEIHGESVPAQEALDAIRAAAR